MHVVVEWIRCSTYVLVYSPNPASSSSRAESWPLSFSFSWTT